MVMQILVMAVQNAVAYEQLGVATSGTTLFRSIGGAVGAALFGGIFNYTLQAKVSATLQPRGKSPPMRASLSMPAAAHSGPSNIPTSRHRGIARDAFGFRLLRPTTAGSRSGRTRRRGRPAPEGGLRRSPRSFSLTRRKAKARWRRNPQQR